ncbi:MULTISPECIES: TetR/AcrR family transcriptional regulator [unclassified Blastococcus]
MSSADPAPATGPEVRDETRDRILQAGMRCTAQYGRAKTTMRDVALAAGVSRATLYRYFADRGALFTGIRQYEHEHDRAEFDRLAAGARSLTDAVAALAEVLAGTSARYRVGAHLAAGDESLAGYMALRSGRERERAAALIRPFVVRAAEAGELRPGVGTEEAEEWIALAVVQATSLAPLRSVDADDPAAVGRWLARMACSGICA